MTEVEPIYVRGRCACGKRFRIRNARIDSVVLCPNCRRVIHLTETDLQAAALDEQLIPLQADTNEMLEVIPLDHGALRMAPEGSVIGLTGAKVLSHEEAALAFAARGGMRQSETYEQSVAAAGGDTPRVFREFQPGTKAFLHDLFTSFYFAGVPRNALNIFALAAAFTLLTLIQYFFVWLSPSLLGGFISGFVTLVVNGLIGLYAIQFFWSVLCSTAYDEDIIPWVQDDRGIWENSLLPLLRLLLISTLCSAPCLAYVFLRNTWLPRDPFYAGILLAAGWFFWPVAVMSVAVGNSIGYLRPDWLIRCIIAIGPAYGIAWLAAMLPLGTGVVYLHYWNSWMWVPVVGIAASLYLGYVLFRTCGLLFRHHRHRLPWRF